MNFPHRFVRRLALPLPQRGEQAVGPLTARPRTGGRPQHLGEPYRSATGLVPNSWWASHSHPRYAWRSGSHPVVKIWRSHGFRWTYGNVDSQHVDGRGQPLTGSFLG